MCERQASRKEAAAIGALRRFQLGSAALALDRAAFDRKEANNVYKESNGKKKEKKKKKAPKHPTRRSARLARQRQGSEDGLGSGFTPSGRRYSMRLANKKA